METGKRTKQSEEGGLIGTSGIDFFCLSMQMQEMYDVHVTKSEARLVYQSLLVLYFTFSYLICDLNSSTKAADVNHPCYIRVTGVNKSKCNQVSQHCPRRVSVKSRRNEWTRTESRAVLFPCRILLYSRDGQVPSR